MQTDPWGEQIPASRRSYPLAALFRGMTLTALICGVVSLRGVEPRVACIVLVGLASVLTAFIFSRQPGGFWTKVAAAAMFGLGFLLVAWYAWGAARLFAGHLTDGASDEIAALFGGCWAVFASPIILVIALLLLRGWVRLANLAGEQGGMVASQACQNCDSRGAA